MGSTFRLPPSNSKIRVMTFRVAIKTSLSDEIEDNKLTKLFNERQGIITRQLETACMAHGFMPVRVLGGATLTASIRERTDARYTPSDNIILTGDYE